MSSHRKLAAILSADVAGYSRLMSENERATVDALNSSRQIIRERIQRHDGRVVDSPGDALLAEFPSALEAVECAAEIQHDLEKRNADVSERRKMVFRIGINLGDVIEEDGALYGDGVNIAARMETLCEPGGVCISGTVFDQIEGKLPLNFAFIGEQQVKNIAKPIRAYRLTTSPGDSGRSSKPSSHKRTTIATAVAVLLVVAAGVIWKAYFAERGALSLSTQAPRLELPDRPSIAVLPFANMSGDPKQDYFADGITEDIITALAKIERLLVIARNSTALYKGKAVDVRQVSRDLGVRHVLEGSVQKQGDRVRVTAQLIDATTGAHLWAEHYDRPLKEIFSVQDEITRKIIAGLDVQMLEGEQARVWRRSTRNVEAYEYFMRGREEIMRFTKEDFALAEGDLQKAIDLDPNFALAYTQLTSVPLLYVILGVSDNPAKDIERAFELQRRGVALDPSQGYSNVQLGRIYMQIGQLDKALEYGKQAVALEPNGATTNAIYGHMLEAAGRCEEALVYVNKALRLSPSPETWIPWLQGNCLRQLGHYDEAIAAQQRAIALAPKYLWPHVFLVEAYEAAGADEQARVEVREVLKLDPNFSVDRFFKIFVWYRDPSFLKSYAENLRKAGLK